MEDIRKRLRDAWNATPGKKYALVDQRGAGSVGFVFGGEDAQGRSIAIKIQRPDTFVDDDHARRAAASMAQESKNLAKVHSPNVVSVVDPGGTFNFSYEGRQMQLVWYGMTLVDGETLDRHVAEEMRATGSRTVQQLQLLASVFEGLSALHQEGLVHCDIKERNIMVARATGQAVILDLGYAVYLPSAGDVVELRGTPVYWPPESIAKLQVAGIRSSDEIGAVAILIPRERFDRDHDLYCAAQMLRALRRRHPKLLDDADVPDVRLLEDRLMGHGPIAFSAVNGASKAVDVLLRRSRRETIPQLCAELEPRQRHAIRLTIQRYAAFSNRVKAVVDTDAVQHLRRVRQLNLAWLVFPEAQHSRFGHALGVMQRVGQYFESLYNDPERRHFRQLVTGTDVAVGLLAGLLHDVGHFPFAHVLEELDRDVFSHENIAQTLLLGGERCRDVEVLVRRSNQLRSAIKDSWHVRPEAVAAVLDANIPPTETELSVFMWRTLRSVVSGPIDADKLDYLRRDGHFAGVEYASGFDYSRFFESLTVDDTGRLATYDKGRAPVEQLMLNRYWMFSEVYWQHTLRAFHAALLAVCRRVFEADYGYGASLNADGKSPFDRAKLLGVLLNSSDEDCLSHWLREGATIPDVASYARSIERRDPYKVFLTVHNFGETEDLYDSMSRLRWRKDGWRWSDGFLERVAHALAAETRMGVEAKDVLLDVPDPQKDHVGGLQMYMHKDGTRVSFSSLSAIWANLANDFHKWARKIRVFVSKDVATKLELPWERRLELIRSLVG